MSAHLDWHIEDESATPSRARPPLWRRGPALLLALAALLTLTLVAIFIFANRRHAELVAQVRRVAEIEEAARRFGEMSTFLALQDRSNEDWVELQRLRKAQGRLDVDAKFGLADGGEPVTYGDVAMEDDYARLDVQRTFAVTDTGGTPQQVVLPTPQFYRPWGESWVRTWPPPDWWGPPQTIVAQRLRVVFPSREASDMGTLAYWLDQWAERACADWGCPDGAQYTLVFTSTVKALTSLNRAQFERGVLALPLPSLVAEPGAAGDRDPITLGYGRLLVRALALELSDASRSPLVAAVAEAEQVRLGLAPAPPPDETDFVGFAWRSGWLNLSADSHLDSYIFSTNTLEMNVTRAFVAFAHDTYAERGDRALLEMARSPGPLEARLAEALDVTPEALSEAWFAYVQARWSNMAGRPEPEGELAVVCNEGYTVKLHDLASGMTQDLTVKPFEVRSMSWSPDGDWLALAMRNGSSDWFSLMRVAINEDGWEGPGGFVAWAPVGLRLALYRPFGQDRTAIYELTRDPFQPRLSNLIQSPPQAALAIGHEEDLPGTPSSIAWSPSGDRLAYVAGDANIWIADGDGSNPRSVARGLSPTWSSDGRLLAYLLPDSLFQPAPELVVMDVESGVTRSVLTISELSGDELAAASLIAPGLVLQSPQATAVYDAAWSPDGSQLLARVALQDATGSGLMAVLTLSPDGRERRVWWAGDAVENVRWSPDGSRLALLSQTYVWVIMFNPLDWWGVTAADYQWSPDGRWLAVEQEMGPAILSADLQAVWRLPLPGCRVGAWRPTASAAAP